MCMDVQNIWAWMFAQILFIFSIQEFIHHQLVPVNVNTQLQK
jgi:hypothetical protein